MTPNKQDRAFTLIELLTVVAIIAILAVIALPNFLEAQTRSKVAAAKSDLRVLASAIEAYATDNNHYPPTPIAVGPRFRAFRPLTSPIAYMETIPRDPFKSIDGNASRAFWRTGVYDYGARPVGKESRWAIASDGPDRQDDTNPLRLYPGYTTGLFFGEVAGFNYTLYDPTNGTISRGDIFRASDFVP
jgi:prepilin-type N-terminal cleavage/methylation domain-containing protein